jgi:hypothetical protein
MAGKLDPREVYGYGAGAGLNLRYTTYRALVQLARAGGVLEGKSLTKHVRSRLDELATWGLTRRFKVEGGTAWEMTAKGWQYIRDIEATYLAATPEVEGDPAELLHAKVRGRRLATCTKCGQQWRLWEDRLDMPQSAYYCYECGAPMKFEPSGGKRRHAQPSLAAEVKALRSAMRK